MSEPTPAVLAEIALYLQDLPTHQQTVEQVAQMAQDVLACDYASVTLRTGRRALETVAATHPVVEKADVLQYEFAEGPCFDAIKDDGDYLAHDIEHDARWTRWGPAAAKLGLCSLLGVRLHTRNHTFGALNLYAMEPRHYDADDVVLARIFAAHASVALAASNSEATLRRAIDTRHVIGQAQGILMERFGIDEQQAFGVLRRLSQDGNVKLKVIAQRVVEEQAEARRSTV